MGLDHEGERKLRENVATLHNNIKKWMAENERLRALVLRRTDDFDATVTALQHEHAEVERLRARQDYWPEMVRLEREVERLKVELDECLGQGRRG